MDENGGGKLTGIRQIVRLKEILQKWQSVTLSSKGSNVSNQPHDGISPAIKQRLRYPSHTCDSDEENCQSLELPPPDVPKGYLAVYVGPELRRFIIPTRYLSDPLFKVLLEKAEEEFGFDHSGGLTIPCEIETFKYLLKCMENNQKVNIDDAAAGKSLSVEE
ncbi:protein SMALL AUXIN UP-REGULATED RNA 51 isoform X2 [Malania oleifera]|uniref:protein SMALL AUXIN UP-REGULATED RNA 51 isoform X2 n=1 Tax=Malania oleifera TaxID=397392 RepID=UPI0025ADB4B4|nr:protein SMALL AUXIN UP-REGULATED RNA 51 isoform X2 [Malania oleifera]XP_057966859.1 protein SMALL AUXIN UP-REGULATED RNA 51 isoform X2 [Malania oleifera]XP_057966860.1 protein SMALL AUXIN UP-REGULATED RNA 51 isoform X2 [Malania oleifera]